MITTTLNRIRAQGPCQAGWRKLLAHLGKTEADDQPVPFSVIVESNGLADALWCCRAEPQHAREWRLFAVWCARRVQRADGDPRSLEALEVAERHANGEATDAELREAAAWAEAAAAWAAAWAAAARAAAAEAAAEAAAAEAEAAAAAWAEHEAQTARFLEVVG